jgi:DNA modification methylase
LGDSYATSRNDHDWLKSGAKGFKGRIAADIPEKNLIGIPWRVAFALQDDGWILRSDCIWSKPNCMPESVTDRPTRAHEYVFLFSKSRRYFYDAAAIAEPSQSDHPSGNGFKRPARMSYQNADGSARGNDEQWQLAPTRNRRTVWNIATQPFKGSHYATMPEALIEPCILAGSRAGDTVLDPFAGSGTVGKVAIRLQRRAVLCELNAAYIEQHIEQRTNGVQVELFV